MTHRLPALLLLAAFSPVLSADDHGTAPARQTIRLAPEERAVVLTEMRAFLSGVQGITEALTREDMKGVAGHARALGRAATHEVPPALMKKLPTGFRQLGFSVHTDFDQMALDAESLGDPKHTMKQLATTLSKCVACHATFALPGEESGAK